MRKVVSFALGSIVTFTLSFSASAALIDRGNGMIYDDVLNVTWLQDANYAQTSGHTGDGVSFGARMTWDAAVAWADGLSFGGFDDWRLPTINVTDTNNSGQLDCDFSFTGGTDCGENVFTGNSELAYMFYENLGNVSFHDSNGGSPQTGWDTLNAAFTDGDTNQQVSFENLFRNFYWSGTEYAPNPERAWSFYTHFGSQGDDGKGNSFYAWALRDGDVSLSDSGYAVSASAPTSLALMGFFLLSVVGFRRKGNA